MPDYGADIPLGAFIACPANAAYQFGTGDFSVTVLAATTKTGVVLSQKGEQGPGWTLEIDDHEQIHFTTDDGTTQSGSGAQATGALDGYWHHL